MIFLYLRFSSIEYNFIYNNWNFNLKNTKVSKDKSFSKQNHKCYSWKDENDKLREFEK